MNRRPWWLVAQIPSCCSGESRRGGEMPAIAYQMELPRNYSLQRTAYSVQHTAHVTYRAPVHVGRFGFYFFCVRLTARISLPPASTSSLPHTDIQWRIPQSRMLLNLVMCSRPYFRELFTWHWMYHIDELQIRIRIRII